MPSKPTLKAYCGDAKTLLAFDLPKSAIKNLAGFTVQVTPAGSASYYLLNSLQFQTPGDHAQDAKEPANSSINAPLHKFRWLHVPGSAHQGVTPFYGAYTYAVTPRYFDDKGSLQAMDPTLTASLRVNVGPFQKNGLELGFTRGFTQSEAFVHHFGLKALIKPKNNTLLFDLSQQSGSNAAGQKYTYEDEYTWLGFTARAKILGILADVLKDASLSIDVFAYDLNEPSVLDSLLKLAKLGRVRIILDNATLHHSTSKPTPEDQFEKLFNAAAKSPAAMLRGKFGRYSHDKVVIVKSKAGATKVLTGSTNFSVTGLYVNSNHVVVFNDPQVAAKYEEVFQAAWTGNVAEKAFLASPLSSQSFSFSSKQTPATDVTFSPHSAAYAETVLGGMVTRIQQEGKLKSGGSVLFAVMQLTPGTGPVYPALQKLHAAQNIFSYGISDTPGGISLYTPGKKSGVLVTGKPVGTQLPPPFDQVPNIGGVGHQIHHKFVICGFNGKNPVVYCGSSNLAAGGEEQNGDNLIAIHDGDVATAFAIEALALVDHFDFLDRNATAAKKAAPKKKTKTAASATKASVPANKQQAALKASWFLSTDDKWAQPYFDPNDLHCVDRQLFS
ncbi:MAG TPA: phospholipase D-like domain-containing protein [Polyangiaceae bacterium]|nr:phospholipase D-like domain-containing protein [Polyangiaceae bacterium]